MKLIKRASSLLGLLSVLLLSSCNTGGIKGNGDVISQEVSLDNYNEIKADGYFNIIYEAKPDAPTYLRIETDSNIVPLVKIKTERNVLSLKLKDEVITNHGIYIYTNSPSLKYIDSRGSTDIYLKGAVAGDDFKLDFRGSGTFSADNLVFASAEFNLRGSSNFTLNGQVDKSKIEVSGNGDVHAFNLAANSLECDIRGNADLEVNALQKLSIDIRGNGSVVYKGNPEISKQEIKGLGSVNKYSGGL